MTRKAIALEAYLSGYSSREAARIAGVGGGYVRDLIRWAGISRALWGGLASSPRGSRAATQDSRPV